MIGDGSQSPYKTVGGAELCTCGHRADAHQSLIGPCRAVESHEYAGPAAYANSYCPCPALEPDEEAA